MRSRAAQLFKERRFYRRSLRLHRDAEIGGGASRLGKKVALASALASALEHQSKQRELSGAAWRGSTVFVRRPPTGPRAHRALHGQRQSLARSLREDRHESVRRNQRALHLGENTGRPNELANVRPHAARIERGHHARQRFRRARGRLFSNLCLQQPGKCGRGRTSSAKLVLISTLVGLIEPRHIRPFDKSACPFPNKTSRSFIVSVS